MFAFAPSQSPIYHIDYSVWEIERFEAGQTESSRVAELNSPLLHRNAILAVEKLQEETTDHPISDNLPDPAFPGLKTTKDLAIEPGSSRASVTDISSSLILPDPLTSTDSILYSLPPLDTCSANETMQAGVVHKVDSSSPQRPKVANRANTRRCARCGKLVYFGEFARYPLLQLLY